jgi:Ca2+-binding EF-hand superfamily protein
LIIEWASNIIDSIKKHSKYDAEVMVFGKMLKNECDEGFRFMIAEAKKAIEDILESQLRKKYKYKREVAIRQLLISIKEGAIEEWLWKGVIEEMYNASHATQLEALINEYMSTIKESEIQEEVHSRERQGMPQKIIAEIPFSVFQKLLLDFQLRTHESYLSKFIQLFKAIDTDTDGIINESQYRELLGQSTCAFEEQDISEMLNYLDPYNHQKITFSDCISLLTQQQTIEKINTIS